MQRLLAEAERPPLVPTPSREPQQRYHELDWLRVFVILALIPGHAMWFFTATSGDLFGTQNANPVGESTLATLGTWGMALLFLVAGAAAYHILGRRSSRHFISERCIRLLLPLLFASLTLIPLQDFLIIHTFPQVTSHMSTPTSWDPHLADSPMTFYLSFVREYVSFLTHYTPQYEVIFWSHLWFLPHLLVTSLVTLPVLLYLQSARGRRFISWLAALCERRRGTVFLLAVPLGLVLAVLGWQWQGWRVGGAPDALNMLAQFLFYTVVYVYGFVLYADERLRQVVRRDGGLAALAVAILAFAITQLPGLGSQVRPHDYTAGGILAGVLRAVAAWLCIVGVLGLSMRFLAFTNRFGRYLTEASYPFYVLHLAVLYLVGLPLLSSGAPALLSYPVMVVLTFAITLGAYELLIRHMRPVRVLFGLTASHG